MHIDWRPDLSDDGYINWASDLYVEDAEPTIVDCETAIIEIAAAPASIDEVIAIDCATAVIEIVSGQAAVDTATVIDCKLAAIELITHAAAIETDVAASTASAARMIVLRPDWVEGFGFTMIAGAPTFVKADDESLDYSIKWDGILEPGETLDSSNWNIGDGLGHGAFLRVGNVSTIWLSGGTPGQNVAVSNVVTTSAGRTYERSFRVLVIEH